MARPGNLCSEQKFCKFPESNSPKKGSSGPPVEGRGSAPQLPPHPTYSFFKAEEKTEDVRAMTVKLCCQQLLDLFTPWDVQLILEADKPDTPPAYQ